MAEKEYIERELAKKTFRNGKHTVKWLIESGAKTIGDSFAMLLDEVPAADVRPVVRGKWELFGRRGIYSVMYECSACHAKYDGKTNFCPHCGADMRADEDVGPYKEKSTPPKVTFRFHDKEHVWINGRQFISLNRVGKMLGEEREKADEKHKTLLRASQRWIPVTEALPEKNQIVVVVQHGKTWDYGQFRGLAYLGGNIHKWNWKNNTTKTVDYWMPKKSALPEPPKEE